MRQIVWALSVALICAVGASTGAMQGASLDATSVVREAATALGGADRIAAVKTLTIEGRGTAYNLGQDMGPETKGQTFVGDYVRRIDLAGHAAITEHARNPSFLYFAGQATQRQVQGVAGDVAFNVAPNGATARVPGILGKDRQAEFYHYPITVLQAALDPAATLANARAIGNQLALDVTTPAGVHLTLSIDRATKRPTRVATKADNANLGDVAIETTFAGYQDVGGLQLPTLLTTRTDRWPTMEVQVTKNTVNGEIGTISAPPPAGGPPPPAPNVAVEEVGPGVWLLAGGSHGSIVVEFSDHLMLIEAPLNDARMLPVITRARALRPGKPLTLVVNLHHHFDHSGGVRAAVSEGLTVIAHKNSQAFIKEVVSRPHMIVPDALARNPQALKLQLVDDEKTFADRSMTVNLYHIDGSLHSTTGLMAYIPSVKLLIEGDEFFVNPAHIYPFIKPLMANISRRGLDVERLYTIHAPAFTPFTDLVKAENGS